MKTATPTKLKTGAWGVKVTKAIISGETVQVSTKSGKTWESKIDKVLSCNKGVSICSVVAQVKADAAPHDNDKCCICLGEIKSFGCEQITLDRCGPCTYYDHEPAPRGDFRLGR